MAYLALGVEHYTPIQTLLARFGVCTMTDDAGVCICTLSLVFSDDDNAYIYAQLHLLPDG